MIVQISEVDTKVGWELRSPVRFGHDLWPRVAGAGLYIESPGNAYDGGCDEIGLISALYSIKPAPSVANHSRVLPRGFALCGAAAHWVGVWCSERRVRFLLFIMIILGHPTVLGDGG